MPKNIYANNFGKIIADECDTCETTNHTLLEKQKNKKYFFKQVWKNKK
jgi:hypothetical protein